MCSDEILSEDEMERLIANLPNIIRELEKEVQDSKGSDFIEKS